ncbi:MAG: hypothetical protein KDB61_07055, partial [Planctomycetes bacterium]|nr:hypothetical protein [Planctomycetota bacterium]
GARPLAPPVGKSPLNTPGGQVGPGVSQPAPIQAQGSGLGTAPAVTTGATPEERLARYAAHMEERLSQLASRGGAASVDFSQVRADFQHNMDRLRAAMDNGLQGDDLARAIENASRMVRDGVRGALGMVGLEDPAQAQAGAGQTGQVGMGAEVGQSTLDVDHTNQRLDAIQDTVMERLNQLLSGSTSRDQSVVDAAREQLQDHMTRLRDAVATGRMTPEDMRRSLANIAQHLSDTLQGTSGMATPDTGGMPGPAGGPDGGDGLRSMQRELDWEGAKGSFPMSGLSNDRVATFFAELRQATFLAKGGVPEGYTADATLTALIHPDTPGSNLDFKV